MPTYQEQYDAAGGFLGLPYSTSTASVEYEDAVMARIQGRNFDLDFAPLEYDANGVTVGLLASADALMIDGVRINGTATFQQQIADEIEASLMTPKIIDELYSIADVKLAPRPHADLSDMGTVAAMVRHSLAVDAQVSGDGGIFADPGKDWALGSRGVVNYGWHKPGGGVIQGQYPGHGLRHSDYSQIMRFASNWTDIDGAQLGMVEAYESRPELFGGPTVSSVPLR